MTKDVEASLSNIKKKKDRISEDGAVLYKFSASLVFAVVLIINNYFQGVLLLVKGL